MTHPAVTTSRLHGGYNIPSRSNGHDLRRKLARFHDLIAEDHNHVKHWFALKSLPRQAVIDLAKAKDHSVATVAAKKLRRAMLRTEFGIVDHVSRGALFGAIIGTVAMVGYSIANVFLLSASAGHEAFLFPAGFAFVSAMARLNAYLKSRPVFVESLSILESRIRGQTK